MDPIKGVQFTPPPAPLLEQAERVAQRAAIQMPQNFRHAVVNVESDGGVNAAIVQRVGSRVEVIGWIGKKWGEKITGGGSVVLTW